MCCFVHPTGNPVCVYSALSHLTLGVICLPDWLSPLSRSSPTLSQRDAAPRPLTHATICRADFSLSDCLFPLEAGGELKDGCMTSCHSALLPTSVPSLCISVTRALRIWPGHINQLVRASLPYPLSALCLLPHSPAPHSFFFFTLPTSQL